VRVTFWGTRGSIATPGPATVHFGGETSCVALEGRAPDHLIVLDAGSGIRSLGAAIPDTVRRVDVFLTHLHLDHIVGLGFFAPIFRGGLDVVIWGPPSTDPLLERLGRYLSPPLFPVRLRDLPGDLVLADTRVGPMDCGGFTITAAPVIHPDPAVGIRVEQDGAVVAYLPDHEPALGPSFPSDPAWTSGAAIGHRADLLIHDAQYTPDEYRTRVGWGHSTMAHAVAFADLVAAPRLALFHHDPERSDDQVETLTLEAREMSRGVEVLAARQGSTLEVTATA
jgi:phosphoribosyl 1,2-cyclic phosphodiesterase